MDFRQRLTAFLYDLMDLVLNSIIIVCAVLISFGIEWLFRKFTGSEVPQVLKDAYIVGGFVILIVWVLGDVAKLAYKHLRGK